MRARRFAVVLVPVTWLASGALACQLLFPTQGEPPGADAGGDAREAGRVGHKDARADVDAGPSVFNELDGDDWQIYSFGVSSPYYTGGAYDGRYVYLCPTSGVATRYDTHLPFTSGWATFDPAKTDGGSDTFAGAVYDGRYVYYGGYRQTNNHATFARFDTTGAFAAKTSWSEYDLTATDPLAVSYDGAAFDGRYVYFAPDWDGHVARFDTTGSFQAATSWSTTDLVTSSGSGFEGALFDGQYVYFVPHYETRLTDAGWGEINTGASVAVQLDSKGTWGSPSSYTTFDTRTLDKNANGFAAGVFDGRYVYFVPYASFILVAVRYDTHAHAFGAASSWEKFDCALAVSDAPSFVGGAFDGRYVYFVPYESSTNAASGILLRFDTTQTFGDPKAWSPYDITTQNANAAGFAGAVFDGEYLYFIPNLDGVVAQFHARTTPFPQLLPTRLGSYY